MSVLRTTKASNCTTSKWILSKRIPDSAIIDAIDQVYATRKASGLADLHFHDEPDYEHVVPLEDVVAALTHLDEVAVRIHASVMLLHGKVMGCFCGTYGQCCRVGKKKTPPSREAKRGFKRSG